MLLPELREEVAKVGKEARRLLRTKGRSGGVQRKRLPEAPLWPLTYLSSTEVRLSISVITSAISYFSLCQKKEENVGVGGGLYHSPPRLREMLAFQVPLP